MHRDKIDAIVATLSAEYAEYHVEHWYAHHCSTDRSSLELCAWGADHCPHCLAPHPLRDELAVPYQRVHLLDQTGRIRATWDHACGSCGRQYPPQSVLVYLADDADDDEVREQIERAFAELAELVEAERDEVAWMLLHEDDDDDDDDDTAA